MTIHSGDLLRYVSVSTHMPLARHDLKTLSATPVTPVSTHMPLARHDNM